MPVLTYTADFREKDGEIISSSDYLSNIQDIESVANNLDWMNVENRSLGNFHLYGGEPTKSAAGLHGARRRFSSGNMVWICDVGYPVSPGCAVYAVAEISWLGSSVQWDGATPLNPIGDVHSPARLRLAAVDDTGAGIGSRDHMNASNPEVHGSAGLVWAYQPTGTAASGSNNLSLLVELEGGGLSDSDHPVLGNLTVFVVHR